MLKRIADILLELETLYKHLDVKTTIDTPKGQYGVPHQDILLIVRQHQGDELILEAKIYHKENRKMTVNIRYDLLSETKKKEIVEGRFESLEANVDQK